MNQPIAFPSLAIHPSIRPSIAVSCMINIALVQYVVRPICENWFGWKLTPLRKFYCALVCAMFAMGISMGVEVARKNSPLLYNPDGTVMLNSSGAPQHAISVFLLIPQYYMVAFGEAFAWVAGIEFYYREIPESMKGIGQATNQMANACSSIFELILVQIVTPFNWLPDNLDSNNGLTYYYCMLLVFCFLAFFWGIFCDWLYARGGGSYEDMVIARKIAEKRRSEGVAAATAFEAGKGADIKED